MSDQPDPWSAEVKPWDFVTQAGRPVNCLQRYTQRATGSPQRPRTGIDSGWSAVTSIAFGRALRTCIRDVAGRTRHRRLSR